MSGTTPAEALDALRERGWTLGVAESLTGGAVCAALVAVPGASAVLLGGVAASATPLQHPLLDVGVSTTGIAGPESPDGQPVGTVHIGVVTPTVSRTRPFHFEGDRDAVRAQTVAAVLDVLAAALRE